MIKSENYDSVICATGTLPSAPSIDGVEHPHVTTAYDIMNLDAEEIGRVSIIGGSALGCYTALYLSTKTDSVDVFEKGDKLGRGLGRTTRWVILKGLRERGIKIHLKTYVGDITRDYLIIEEDGSTALHATDTVVLATSPSVNNLLFTNLQSMGFNVHRIGSIKTSMNLLEAVHEAFLFASNFEID